VLAMAFLQFWGFPACKNGDFHFAFLGISSLQQTYHQGWCRYLSKSKIEITLKEAKAEGYTPCKVCNPPQ